MSQDSCNFCGMWGHLCQSTIPNHSRCNIQHENLRDSYRADCKNIQRDMKSSRRSLPFLFWSKLWVIKKAIRFNGQKNQFSPYKGELTNYSLPNKIIVQRSKSNKAVPVKLWWKVRSQRRVELFCGTDRI